MGDLRDWIEEAENRILFEGNGTQGNANAMLEYSETNRTLTGELSRFNIMWRQGYNFCAEVYGDLRPDGSSAWGFLKDFALSLELYMLTLGEPENSRKQYERIAIAEEIDKKKQGLPFA